MSYTFKFAGTELSELCAVVTKRPPREVALYDFELISISGKSGDDYIDNKRYKNVIFSRQIGFVDRENTHIADFDESLIDWLAYCQGYQEFEDTDHPGLVTYAALTNFAEVQTVLCKHHKATLKFSRVPFWFSKTGLEPITVNTSLDLSAGITVTNPYKLPAQYVLKLTLASGKESTNIFKLQIGSKTIQYLLSNLKYSTSTSAKRRYIIMDLEIKEIRAQTTETGGDIAFSSSALPPALEYNQQTTIRVSEDNNSVVQSMTLIPRWRKL